MIFLQRAVRTILVVAALLMPLAVATVVSATPASAASCSGSSCTGKDPSATGCASSGSVTTTQGVWNGDLSVELRHSSGCGTFWARMTLSDSNCCFAMQAMVERQLKTPYGYYDANVYYRSVLPAAGGPGTWWTAMVPNTSDDRTRACYRLGTDSNNPKWSGWSCTGWH